ncbi:unnamed protein product [Caenorhabditis brenneri]
MSGEPKKVTEEELEKQYADYRAQFEQWKENNKSSIGTEAYNKYCSQFEQWEREVEVRKAQQSKQRKNADQEAEVAAAYAQSQEAYMLHHVKAMEQAENQQRAVAAAAAAAAAVQQQMMQNMMMRQTAEQTQLPTERDIFMKLMLEGWSGNFGDHPPPLLWGTQKTAYDARDPLFAKFGERAAPAHHRPEEIDKQINPVPCWLLLDTLKNKKMVLAPHSNTCPPPPVQQQAAPPPVGNPPPQQ